MLRTGLAPLALVLASCSQLVTALRCLTCHEPSQVSSCIVSTCNANETMCQTTFYPLETEVLGYIVVTMSCVSQCEPPDLDPLDLVQPMFCCNTDLCNLDGAPALGGPHDLALTLTLTSLLSLLL